MPTITGRSRTELLPPPSTFYTNELRKMSRRRSRGWVRALCPFHPDRHPSLAVNLQTGGFYCFSCGERGGGLIDFLMNDGVSFKEALPAAFLIPASTGQVLSPRRKTALRYTALVRVINAGRATTASLIRT